MAIFEIYTLGCKVNQIESDSLSAMLIEAGHTRGKHDCAIAIINGCAVTQTAEKKSQQLIARIRRHNPATRVIFAGCAADKISDEQKQALDCDAYVGNSVKNSIPEVVEALLGDSPAKKAEQVDEFQEYVFERYPQLRTRAFIKIQDGCDNYCSYCIIPFLRGSVRSRPLLSIKNELGKIAAAGFCEIVLTGIHLGNYGKELGFANRLADVVELALAHEGNFRVRIGSIESPELSDKLIELFERPRLCRHLHLPLQSGCDATLVRMNRNYKAADYQKLLNKLCLRYSDMAITADVIAGFPGETEEEFLTTVDFVKSLPLAGLHVFPFSRRSGTAAWAMPDQVTAAQKKARATQLAMLGKNKHEEFMKCQLGKVANVLIEGNCADYSYGYSENYQKVFVREALSTGSVARLKLCDLYCDGMRADWVES